MRFSIVLATIIMSTVAFGQQDGFFHVGYAANLNIGDSVVNISNDGINGGVFGAVPATSGNICVNAYVFDPQEEEIGCCSCLVTPNGLNSLSVKSDLISNNLTPAVPTSVVIKLFGSIPDADKAGAYTVCNPATVLTGIHTFPVGGPTAGVGSSGMLAWGTTLEPNSTPGTYNAVPVPFLNASVNFAAFGLVTCTATTCTVDLSVTTAGVEVTGLTSLCNFIQANGTGFGICKSCRLGALGGAKK
jgi:hypothetical protein